MKKSILFASVIALLATTTASAQSFNALKVDGGLEKANVSVVRVPQVKNPLLKAELNANQRLAGYYTSDEVNNALGLGSYTTEDIQPGVLLEPSDYQQYAGAKVVGVRFAVGPNTTVKGVEIDAMTAQGALSELATKDTTFASKSPTDYSSYTWNTVMLPEESQFEVSTTDYAALMVSYKCSQGRTTYPVAVNDEVTGRTIYICANIPSSYGGSGLGWYNMGTDGGAPAIQLIVESDEFPTNGVAPLNFGKFTALIGSTKTVYVDFSNLGTSLNNFDYTVTVNGVTSAETHVNLGSNALGVGGSFSGAVSFTVPATAGTYDVIVNVTKVNGVANEASTTSAQGTLVALAKKVKRGVVVEEFTGTGCQWCPRGLAGMKVLAETYPDNFVGIGIHQYNSNDPMYTGNYANLGFTGAPSCMLDRNGSIIDPYYGSGNSIKDDFDALLEELPYLGVEVSGMWNADSTSVVATATVDPMVSGNYNIDFVLVADSLTGTATSWGQTNGFASYTASQVNNDPNLTPFCSGGKYGKNPFKYPFDDVLIASSYSGTTNKATLDELTEGVKTTASYTLKMPTSATLKKAINKKKVYVIAIVYDADGVANAAKGVILADPTGINGVHTSTSSDAVVVARYNAAGQLVNGEQQGLNIVKMSDGKVVKYIK